MFQISLDVIYCGKFCPPMTFILVDSRMTPHTPLMIEKTFASSGPEDANANLRNILCYFSLFFVILS